MTINIKSFYITVTFSFLALLAFTIISNTYTGYLMWIPATLIHEIGHIIPMFLLNCKPLGILVSAFDVKIINNYRYNQYFLYDIIITVLGPVFNIVSFFLFIFINKTFAYVNLFIGLFNLLPSTTLDGGQLLYLLLSRKYSYDTTSVIIDVATIITSFPLFVLGFLVLISSKYNFSLLFISMYLILSLFLKKDKL